MKNLTLAGEPSKQLARAARSVILAQYCAPSNIPVEVVPGSAEAPKLAGCGYRWETPGGRPVRYPSAYMRAFGRPVYVHSTRRVVVGACWTV